MADIINIEREGAAVTKALRAMLAKAREAGIQKPRLYFESEGSVASTSRAKGRST
jgi:hypothetical protein